MKEIKRIGTLSRINQAVRLITNLGYTVIGLDGLTVSTLELGDIEFTETKTGRVMLK